MCLDVAIVTLSPFFKNKPSEKAGPGGTGLKGVPMRSEQHMPAMILSVFVWRWFRRFCWVLVRTDACADVGKLMWGGNAGNLYKFLCDFENTFCAGCAISWAF